MDQSIQPINDVIFANLQLGSLPDNPSETATSESGKFSQALSKGYFWAFLFVFVGRHFNQFHAVCLPINPDNCFRFWGG